MQLLILFRDDGFWCILILFDADKSLFELLPREKLHEKQFFRSITLFITIFCNESELNCYSTIN